VLEVEAPPPLGITPGNREQLALAQRLTRAYMSGDYLLLQELVCDSLIPFDRFLPLDLSTVCNRVKERILQRFRVLNNSYQKPRERLEQLIVLLVLAKEPAKGIGVQVVFQNPCTHPRKALGPKYQLVVE
jgi:hypothetical protein